LKRTKSNDDEEGDCDDDAKEEEEEEEEEGAEVAVSVAALVMGAVGDNASASLVTSPSYTYNRATNA
jgi:hypothetical protein